jgi:polyhydroxyalkanoate synthesis repressor PhaR
MHKQNNDSANESPDAKVLELRKYPNRRYYDMTRSCHVNRDEIYRLIRDGYRVSVTESKSGDDITAQVLTQIILEHDPPKLEVFPTEMLHRLLQTNEHFFGDFVDKYFNSALDAYAESQRLFEDYFRRRTGVNQTGNEAAGGWNLWAPFLSGPAAAHSKNLEETIRDLQRQVSALQQKLDGQNDG